jgi:hypothetical protein
MDITDSDAEEGDFDILVFGGEDEDDTRMDRCMVYSSSLPALEDGTLTALSKQTANEQKTEDRLRDA